MKNDKRKVWKDIEKSNDAWVGSYNNFCGSKIKLMVLAVCFCVAQTLL